MFQHQVYLHLSNTSFLIDPNEQLENTSYYPMQSPAAREHFLMMVILICVPGDQWPVLRIHTS